MKAEKSELRQTEGRWDEGDQRELGLTVNREAFTRTEEPLTITSGLFQLATIPF